MESLLWWLFKGSKGEFNRVRIMDLLKTESYNAYNLSEILELNYKTVRHHLKLLEEHNIIATHVDNKYGAVYFLTEDMKDHIELFEEIKEKLKVNS
ncbi:winged helix-turn-helix domain-containing protein [Methanobacterium sp. SMA-27]|uniref:ArsR/SmtB family transcription factor n=1 Tax=Methanobacterium sp. SMA-27 TaxID=1495336 RepID=UPI00064FDC82|nr:winged helix-turn-helix domain-containing protein [Methanobacterium sp. SMA-27]